MDYDVFLSHSHYDKPWARELHDYLATKNYNDRVLRVWLDVEVLYPGKLSSSRELESALDRSRRLVIVLAPESLISTWVQHEISYFLGLRGSKDVILVHRRSCTLPDQLVNCELIDWPESADGEEQRKYLLQLLRPAEDNMAVYQHGHAVKRGCGNAFHSLPQDFDPRPTDSTRKLMSLLLKHDVSNTDEEGLALIGFTVAGQYVAELDAQESYAMRMALGEFIALAILRNPAYAAVARSYIRKEERSETQTSFTTFRNRALQGKSGPPSHTNLLFAVSRSASKLAAIDPSLVDLATLAAILHHLDQRPKLATQEILVAMIIARTLGKLRGSEPVDALLHALSRWGRDASHVATAGAISSAFDDDDPDVFYTDELEQLVLDAHNPPVPPPLPRIAHLLFDKYSGLTLNLNLEQELSNSRADYTRNFGSWEADADWPELKYAPAASRLENGPLVGRVRRVTLANMESLAEQLGPSDIACLTEPRIVDALLESAGGFLIDELEADAPLGQRLRSRGVRFASYKTELIQGIEEGIALVLWPGKDSATSTGFKV